MQPRERKLAIIAGVVLACAAGYLFFNSSVTGRFKALRSQKKLLEESVEKLEEEQLKVIRAERNLADWTSRSFPPDAVASQRMYLAWLTDLAQAAGFSASKLSPDRRVSPNKDYFSFRVTIEANAKFSQLCHFLFLFRRADLLHRIADLTVEGDDGTGKNPLKVRIVAEGVSLKRAAPRPHLFPKTELAAEIEPSSNKISVTNNEGFPTQGEFLVRSGSELLRVEAMSETTWNVLRGIDGTTAAVHKQGVAVELFPLNPAWKKRTFEDFRELTSQNPFAKPEKPKPPETPKKEEPKPVVKLDDPAAKTTKFVGATTLNDDRRVCFLDPSNDKRTYVKEGESFAVAGIKGTLVAVHTNHILLQIEEEKWRLDLGKELAAMKKLDAAGNPVPTPAGEAKPEEQPKTPPADGEKPDDTPSKSESADPPSDEKKSDEASGSEGNGQEKPSDDAAPSDTVPATPADSDSSGAESPVVERVSPDAK